MSQFCISVIAAYGYALAVWPLLRTRGRFAGLLAVVLAFVVLFCPLLIPAENVKLRAGSAYLCIELFFKMLDYSRQFRRRETCGSRFADYARFLIPFPVLLVVYGERRFRLPADRPRGPDVLRFMVGVAVFASGFLLVYAAAHFAVVRNDFLLDHAILLVIFVLTIEGLAQAVNGLERLAGFRVGPIIHGLFLSRTVAEFWNHYNGRVRRWFELNLFRPAGARRSPVRGVCLCFFLSGVLHELMFGIATSRYCGYQFLFFMLQAPAVLLAPRLQRYAKRGRFANCATRAVTIVWMYFTSIFFLHDVNRVFPFIYAARPWLP